MPYALIPDGYTLKKVTAAQLEAVSAKRSHEDFMAILSNPGTAQLVGTAGLALATAHFLPLFLEKLEEKVGDLTDDFKEGVNETVNELNPLNAVRKIYGGKTNEELIAELKEREETKRKRESGELPSVFEVGPGRGL